MAKRKYIYFAEIERFGYTLQCIGLTENEVRQAMINKYIETYKNINRVDPSIPDEEDNEYYEGDYSYYKTFLDELYVEKRELLKVEWT